MEHELKDHDVERLAHTLEEGFNRRDVRLIESVISPHLVDHSAALGGVDLRQRMARVQAAVPDATYRVEQYMVQGSAIAWRWTIRGRHEQEIMRYPPTGKEIVMAGMSMAVVRHGKAVEH